MRDENLIACLYPAGSLLSSFRGLDTIRAAPGSMRLAPLLEDRALGPESPQSLRGDNRGSRGQRAEADKPPHYHYSPGIQLRFDQLRKNQIGFVFGKDASCDVVLPRTDSLRGIGDRQCVIMFDIRGRLILRDLRDPRPGREATSVSYSGLGGDGRRGFTWVLSGDDVTRKQSSIIISFHSNLSFQIVVAPHDFHSPRYKQKVSRFRDSTVHSSKFLDVTHKYQACEAQTVTPSSILIKDGELGRGSQAVVSQVWDVSTGTVYACKEPLDKKNKEQLDRLRTEAKILRRISHANIVRLIFLRKRPIPLLVLECIPLQSMDEQVMKKPFSAEETMSILQQGLSALRHLHEREKPIVHRDIKPANILIQSRTPRIHIKLCDFGFSKASRNFLATKVGTPIFTAPEVFTEDIFRESVDIWSLGVVILLQSHGLPCDDGPHFDGEAWAWKIVWFLNALAEATSCPLVDFLTCYMLVKNPVTRIRAFGSQRW
ncbi:kinase [Hirsutella rhossiliensis]|uniref:Kinase n=1 Tax=Hirsutella rhossiliensis TaxID=111463 RepID=A0A9P8NC60_9HYPO|nr:kinase [Hirsutella rhossiliensis]KAH0968457.1 kinase [Hirsutella rhossiliensis]